MKIMWNQLGLVLSWVKTHYRILFIFLKYICSLILRISFEISVFVIEDLSFFQIEFVTALITNNNCFSKIHCHSSVKVFYFKIIQIKLPVVFLDYDLSKVSKEAFQCCSGVLKMWRTTNDYQIKSFDRLQYLSNLK